MVAPLRRVLVRRPDEAFAAADPARWHYAARPDLGAAQAEHDRLTAVLRDGGAQVLFHDADLPDLADAIFVFDPALVTDAGAVMLSMGKELRRGEETAMARRFEELGIPVVAALTGDARAEGGDLLWLDHDTLYAGVGFRTNAEGVGQLHEALAPLGIVVRGIDLPCFAGPEACLHLLSLISLVDDDLAVVYEPLLPVTLWQELRRRRMELIRVSEAEFKTQGTNVLALAPRRCLALEDNVKTIAALEAAGCEVATYRGRELSHKAEGGPTCLTRPLLREA
jgi:N-dimethylarginine dimethylaminohydrolase